MSYGGWFRRQQGGLVQAFRLGQTQTWANLPPNIPHIPHNYSASYALPDALPPPKPMPENVKMLHNHTFHELLGEFQALLEKF